MNQRRRSFLRRAVGVLLAPLGVAIFTIIDAKAELKRITPLNAELLKLAERFPAPQEWYCEVVYDGFIIDEKGRKWAKWRPGKWRSERLT